MKKITGIIIALSVFMVILMMPVSAADVTYNIRSTVYDSSDSSAPAGDFYWDGNSFSGFWYQIKPGLSSEVLYFHNSVNASSTMKLGDKIAEGDLYYVSKPQMKKTKIGGMDDGSTFVVDGVDLKKYYLMGFFGSQYLAMPENPADLSAGCQPDKIAKILMETGDDKKQMSSGDKWELAGGWSLVVQQVDVEGKKVWLQLNKGGEEIDTAVVSGDKELASTQRTYLYKDKDDNPVFYCYVDSVFQGTADSLVVFKYAFLRGDITTIQAGDSYGAFEVEAFKVPAIMNGVNYAGSGSGTVLHTGDNALVMSSNKDITLNPDKTFDLYGGMYLKTEDTSSPVLKMALWKTNTIKVPDASAENKAAEEKKEDIVVVDFEKAENKGGQAASVSDKAETTSTSDAEDAKVVESSAKAPGFELLIGLLGLIGAARVRK
jgi:S-layer protein (TIGR01567 family)